MKNLYAAISGTVFGIGLAISGMTNPAKVLGFLDITGQWDPTLAFVMGGALAVSAIGTVFAKRRGIALIGTPIQLPTRRDIDTSLIAGAALFGLGWGMVGLCPGPAVAALFRADTSIFIFMLAMLGGIVVQRLMFADTNSSLPLPSA